MPPSARPPRPPSPRPPEHRPLSVVFVCTGNATRSVLAASMAAQAASDRDAEWTVHSAGTFVVEGQPVSWRTRRAFDAVGLPAPNAHRSRQLTDDLLSASDLVVAMAGEHVRFVRRTHPHAAPRTATVKRLLRDLPPPAAGTGVPDLQRRIAALRLEHAPVEPDWEDVDDPGGGEVDDFVACARELRELMDALLPRLVGGGG